MMYNNIKPGDLLYYGQEDATFIVIDVSTEGVRMYDVNEPVFNIEGELFTVFCSFEEIGESLMHVAHVNDLVDFVIDRCDNYILAEHMERVIGYYDRT